MSDEQPEPEPFVAPAASELTGRLIADRYLVKGLIGRGGMGTVYEAEHVHMKKRVAIKVLHSQLSINPDVVARFEREAVAAARLEHPGVVTARDFGRLPSGDFYLVLEYVDGESLARLIERESPLDPERAFQIAVQINSAMVAAHDAGIVHRDLKPDNILLMSTGDDEDFVKVLDFGIAKIAGDAAESQQGLTRAGTVFGTPEYMAPEQARGDVVDHRADLYALGMIIYEMLCGRSAFRHSDVMAVLTAQMMDPPPPLPEEVPAPFVDLTMSLLAKDPMERPQSARDLAAYLAKLGVDLHFSLPTPRTSAGTRLEMTSALESSTNLPKLKRPAFEGVASLKAVSMRPLPVAGRTIPLFLPVAALMVGIAIGTVSILSLRREAPPHVTELKSAEKQADDRLLVGAESGDRDALSALRQLTEAELLRSSESTNDLERAEGNLRAARRYIALGRGFSVIKHYPAALDAYENAVKLDAHAAEHEDLLSDVRVALEDRDTVEKAIEFCRTYLGPSGADLIFDVYRDNLGQPGRTAVVARAQRIIRDKEFTLKASPALAIAMDLERAQVCAEYRELIPKALLTADERALRKLEILDSPRGCGPKGMDDCYVCLRRPEIPLKEAIAKATARKEPSFLGPSN